MSLIMTLASLNLGRHRSEPRSASSSRTIIHSPVCQWSPTMTTTMRTMRLTEKVHVADNDTGLVESG